MARLLPVFWLLLFLSFSFVSFMNCLKANDTGACVVKMSLMKTRNKAVTVSKWCGKKKCLGKKNIRENYKSSKTQIICCKGWEYVAESRICSPLCSMGCSGRRCVGPEVCACDPPRTLHPDSHTCIDPCDPPCYNAECVNSTCQCISHFSPFNSSHCFQCDPGYGIDLDFICKPKCDNCANGRCSAPNVCSCDAGYENVGGECRPICESCSNGQCVVPGNCSCNADYEKVNGTCTPICESCEHGKCVAPNNCECNDGFNRTSGVCAPICEDECVNSHCSSPNVCTCEEGFNETEEANVCAKLCDVSSCNGTCDGMRCLPVTCEPTLTTQIKYKTRLVRTKINCGKKNCPDKTRIEKYPVKPKLSCCDGWEYHVAEDKCLPMCSTGCPGGHCSDPEICSCDPPYIDLNGTCVIPTCLPSCYNAECTNINVCECRSTFSRINTTHCAKPCPDGYSLDYNSLECQPICDPPCVNATCTAPNVCTCNNGYNATDIVNECAPICQTRCTNGNCVAPDLCSCHSGYTPENSTSCVPVCDSCENGDCIRPNICNCHDGYTKEDGICKPVCNSCDNGKCVAPNNCRCNDGYFNDENTCKPYCDGCSNGHCDRPNTCICNNGYKWVDKECVRICDPFCANVPCDSPYNCTCFSGYVSFGSGNMCKPKCTGCDHGVCIAPDVCQCHDGYALIHGICLPVCLEECVNANCFQPAVCMCFEGYVKNETKDNVCYKPCRTPCNSGTCNIDGECICGSGSELINGTCVSIEPVSCDSCFYNCTDGECSCPDGVPCFMSNEVFSDGMESNATLAGLGYTWLAGAMIGLLLMALVVTVMVKLWKKHQRDEEKPAHEGKANGSVLSTLPGTLMNRSFHPGDIAEEDFEDTFEDQDHRIEVMDYEKEELEAAEKLMKAFSNP